MRYLILLDKKFPFKSGEAFLENEIDEISPFFDKILIFPSDPKINSKTTRKIKSKNVTTFLFESIDYSKRKFYSMFLSILSKPFKKNDKRLSISNILVEKYFSFLVKEQSRKIMSILEKIEFNKNDTVYLYSYWFYVTAGVCVELKKYFKAKNIKCRAVSRAHRFDIYEDKRYLPAREYLMDNIDSIYTCSDNGAEYLKTNYSNYSKKIMTSYLGTYDHGIGNMSNDGIFRIVSCSRISNIKRVKLIVKILNQCKTSKKIVWTHIGNGNLFDEVKKYAEKYLDQNQNIEYNFLGYMTNTEVYEFYKNNTVDLFINVSSSEGLPVSIMESASFGIPIIATDVGGTREIVIDGISGFLINKNFDVLTVSNIIEELINMDKAQYKKLRRTTRNLWKEKFEARKNYKSFVKMIINEKD